MFHYPPNMYGVSVIHNYAHYHDPLAGSTSIWVLYPRRWITKPMLRHVSLDPSGISSKSLTASRPVLALDLEVGRPYNRKKSKSWLLHITQSQRESRQPRAGTRTDGSTLRSRTSATCNRRQLGAFSSQGGELLSRLSAVACVGAWGFSQVEIQTTQHACHEQATLKAVSGPGLRDSGENERHHTRGAYTWGPDHERNSNSFPGASITTFARKSIKWRRKS
ncbi:hypothetical protein CUC08_Gglean006860 [Alternaria sp. MG1]|nr:hypothetical protein CUC08_Gglean006860 [Alternaria sp. MG1]